jgi:hypothetical protein
VGGGDEGGDKGAARVCALIRGDGGVDWTLRDLRERVGDRRGPVEMGASSEPRGVSGRGMLGGVFASGKGAKDSTGTGLSFDWYINPRRLSRDEDRVGLFTPSSFGGGCWIAVG